MTKAKQSKVVSSGLDALTQANRQRFLRDLFGHAPIAVQVYSADGHHQFSNDAALKLFGVLPPPEYTLFEDCRLLELGRTQILRDMVHNKSFTVQLPPMAYNLRDTHPNPSDEIPDADLWLQTSVFSIFDQDGQVSRLVIMHQDMTDKVSAENAWQNSERELVSEQAFFRDFIELNPFGVIVLEPDGRFASCNAAFRQLFEGLDLTGYNFFSDRNLRDGNLDDVIERLRQKQVVATNEPVLFDTRNMAPYFDTDAEHRRRWLKPTVFPLSGPDGDVRNFVVMVEDVTAEANQAAARKQAETLLRKERNFLQKIIALNPYSILVLDPDGYIVSCNDAYRELFGGEPPYGSIFADLFLVELGIADELAGIRQGRVVRIDREIPFPTAAAAQSGIHPAGKAPEWLRLVVFPIFDDDGALQNIVLMHKDLTDRKTAEEKRRQIENRFKAMLEWANDLYVILDENLRVTDLSATIFRVLGWSPEDLEDRESMKLMHPDDLPIALAVAEEALGAPGKRITFEVRIRHKEGQYVLFDGSVRNLLDDPSIRGLLINLRDITQARELAAQRERMEEQIRQMQKLDALGTLAGGIAHDFNTVLSVIQGFAEITHDHAPGDGHVAYNQGQILTAVARAKTLVEKILTFSRRIEKERRPIPINRVVEEALRLLTGYLPATIKISLQFDDDTGLVLADPTEIHQIVMNLCLNAYDAMADTGGRLSVTLTSARPNGGSGGAVPVDLPPGRYCRLAVHDTGTGMPAETKARALEPFFSTKPVGEGTGMGLPVVHGIVQSCGGAIVIDSEPGNGTTVSVFLPVVEVAEPEPIEPKIEPPRGSELVLLVDDEPQIVEVFTSLMVTLGYRVEAFTDPRAALARFAAAPDEFDLIVTDQIMPEMSGLQLARAALVERPGMPIVISSAFEKQETIDAIKAMPSVTFLRKPFERVTLALSIRETLDRKDS